MLRKPKFLRSLRSKMLLWAFVFVVPILAILYGTIWSAAGAFEAQTLEGIRQLLPPFAADIDASLASAKLYIANLKVDLSPLAPQAQGSPANLEALASLADGISEDLALYPQIDAVFLCWEDEVRFVQNYGRSYAQSRQAALALKESLDGLSTDIPYFQQGYLYFETPEGFYLYVAMNAGGGVVGCWFSADSLFQDIRAAGQQGMAYVMFSDRQGRLLHAQFDTPSSRLLAQKLAPYLVTRASLASAPFEMVVLWDENVVLAPVQQMYRGVLAAISVACLLFALYVLFLRVSLVKPLSRLVGAIDGIRGGNLAPIPMRASDGLEIDNVYRALNAMIDQIDTLKIQMYEEKLVKQKTQMQLFQLQIRPHFLLNALNTIVSFARIRDYDMVQKMTMYLATHCRYILYNPWYVTLEEELVYTQNFIDMQSAQHDERYRYAVQVEDALLDSEIPILGIQIFVENSLKYAHNLDRPILIQVDIRRQEVRGAAYLHIQIDDNGDGFSSQALSACNNPDAAPPGGEDHGIGIANIRRRLKILYDDQAWLRFSNRPEGGARVELFLPMNRREGANL